MAKLTYEHRKHMATKEFALPEKKAFPIEDKAHARNAKARASMSYNEGHISASEKATINRKANRKLGIKEHEAEHWGD
jgi:hypothetical protein